MKKTKPFSSLESMRHSTAHLMAAAVKALWPETKFGIGPAIENGFYYDFELPVKLAEEDLPKIERQMEELKRQGLPITRSELPINKALEWALETKQDYKAELIEQIKETGDTRVEDEEAPSEKHEAKKKVDVVSFYTLGDFTDLCRGPHLSSTDQIGHFKLLNIAGAYWRGSENNPMLTRIYGTAWPTKEELEKHLWQLEEIKKRDHRKIGKELDLFTFAEEVGPGLPLWTPKGTILQLELENWAMETEKKRGYVRVRTPHIAKHTLYEISGHLPYYKDDMYSPMNIDGEDYYLKGMNCPHHHMVYKSSPKSYKDLPLRYAEYGTVYRYERSGELFGLMRVRFIQQNDAHIYCTIDQAEKEFLDALKLHEYYYNILGLTRNDYHVVVGLPDESKKDKYHGDKELWAKAEKIMRSAIKKSGIKSVDDVGGAAFYGPKVDFNITSSVGREFGISTNQLDLYMPTRFNLTYTDKDGRENLVAVIHRAPLGSHERLIGFLIEHFAGAFPVWLAPVQAIVLPITDRNTKYAQAVLTKLQGAGVRGELDDRSETLQAKIRDAQIQKVPYMLVVGDKEEKEKSISLRLRSGKDLGQLTVDAFLKQALEAIKSRALN